MAGLPHIPSLAPDPLFYLGQFPVTNTVINIWVAIAILLPFGIYVSLKTRLKPGRIQNACEYVLELLLPYFDQVTGDRKKTFSFLPIVGSTFFFILLSNWLGLMPGVGSITLHNVPLFRAASTDLNVNLAMAAVSVLGAHLYGFFAVGFFTHIGKFIQIGNVIKNIFKGPLNLFTAFIQFFVGLIEIVSELAKVVSLSLRLFGNIFAGEVLLSVMAALLPLVIPTPFLFLELLVGVVQAGVFAMLTLVYLVVASYEPHGVHESV